MGAPASCRGCQKRDKPYIRAKTDCANLIRKNVLGPAIGCTVYGLYFRRKKEEGC